MKATNEELSVLRMFGPETHSMKLGPIGALLESKGLVQWIPSWMPGGLDYQITDLGKRIVEEAQEKGR